MEEIGRFNCIFLEESLGNGRYIQRIVDADTGEMILQCLEDIHRPMLKRIRGFARTPGRVVIFR